MAPLPAQVQALRRELELACAPRAPSRGSREELRRLSGPHLGWIVTVPSQAAPVGWVSLPRDWTAVAITADAAWRFAPLAGSGRGPLLAALDAAGRPVARWDRWWRLRQRGWAGPIALRLRPAGPRRDRWRLADAGGRLADVTPGGSDAAVAFASLRIEWARTPPEPALLGMFLAYVLAIRTLRRPWSPRA
jgi:hypothetical protein